MLSNLGTEGMTAEDGPRFSGRSVPLASMLHPPRRRRWPRHEGVRYWLTRLKRHHGDSPSSGRAGHFRYAFACPIDSVMPSFSCDHLMTYCARDAMRVIRNAAVAGMR